MSRLYKNNEGLTPDMQSGVRPLIAIIDNNTLAAIGLKGILTNIMPMMNVDIINSLDEIYDADRYFHFFVAMSIVLDNRNFFIDNKRKTIVLTTASDPNSQLSDFHCLCTGQSEHDLIKSILSMVQRAHANGHNLPPTTSNRENVLSDREIEVLSLIVQGNINKEIADKLNISLSTVITHRRNIMEKLNAKSVSALTIYAVMHGFVDITQI
ncbi:MAG: response regulator transcription factor [Prevotella sp.]